MSTYETLLPTLELGPNCEECPGASSCPAMTLRTNIDDLNADFDNPNVAFTAITDRVKGEVFAFGITRFEKKIATTQTVVDACLGSVEVKNGDKKWMVHPAFGESITDRGYSVDTKDELVQRGFSTGDTTFMGEDGVIYANSVSDPAIEHLKNSFGYVEGFPLSELSDAVKSFRRAASFIVQVER